MTWLAIAVVSAAAILLNLGAFDAPYYYSQDGQYGTDVGLGDRYEHGWPFVFVTREPYRSVATPGGGAKWVADSAWAIWQQAQGFCLICLLADVVIWLGLIVSTAIAVQFWRSRRKSIWNFFLADAFGGLTIIAILLGWMTNRVAKLNAEDAVMAARDAASDDSRCNFHVVNRAPAWLPEQYHAICACIFGRELEVSGQFKHVPNLSNIFAFRDTFFGYETPEELADFLKRNPQLVALDLGFSNPSKMDESDQFTILRFLPPVPNLRAINLNDSAVSDGDMVWLASCQKLEVIDLTGTDVGDAGLRLLATLPNLKKLLVGNREITDEGCRRLSQMTSLQELTIETASITDEGIMQLSKLKNLRLLRLRNVEGLSKEGLEELQNTLADCKIELVQW